MYQYFSQYPVFKQSGQKFAPYRRARMSAAKGEVQAVNIGIRAIFCHGGGGGGGEPFAKIFFVTCPIFKKQSKRNEGHTMHQNKAYI